ncbi:hypothetical protein V8E52_005946 [Russula decolorans]
MGPPPDKARSRESFYRRQELDRHIQRFHLPCWLYCPYSRCEWRGCRIDELQKHLDHQRCNQNSTEREYQIYDVKTILDMIRDAESNDSIRIAQDWAVDFVRERARELGKQGWFMDPWGCLEQRERQLPKKTSHQFNCSKNDIGIAWIKALPGYNYTRVAAIDYYN